MKSIVTIWLTYLRSDQQTVSNIVIIKSLAFHSFPISPASGNVYQGIWGEMPCLPCNQIWARMWVGGRPLFLPCWLVLDGYSGCKDLAWSSISSPANTQEHPSTTTIQLFPWLQIRWALNSSRHNSFNYFIRRSLQSSQVIFTGCLSSVYKNSCIVMQSSQSDLTHILAGHFLLNHAALNAQPSPVIYTFLNTNAPICKANPG